MTTINNSEPVCQHIDGNLITYVYANNDRKVTNQKSGKFNAYKADADGSNFEWADRFARVHRFDADDCEYDAATGAHKYFGEDGGMLVVTGDGKVSIASSEDGE